MDVELRTPRLLLRPLRSADAGAIATGLNDYEVTRYLTVVPFPYAVADAISWLATLPAPEPAAAHFAITADGTGLIGAVTIEDELGYWLDRRFHGRGIMTEAAEALLAWHFAALPDSVVHSGAHVGNEASLQVQRKLGFIDAGTRSMRFARSQNRDIEHVETILTQPAFEAARQSAGRM